MARVQRMAGMQLLVVCFLLIMVQSSSAFFFFNTVRPTANNNLTANGTVNEECVAKARHGDCRFYQCFNERYPCPDAVNYAIKYGFRFCSRFDGHRNQMNAQGQRWLNGTRRCAMEKMLDLYRLDALSCADVDRQMKSRQAACDAENGLCDERLLVDNREVFSDVYALNYQSADQFLQTLKQCTLTRLLEVTNWFRDQLHNVENVEQRVQQITSDIQGRFSRLSDTFQQIGRALGV